MPLRTWITTFAGTLALVGAAAGQQPNSLTPAEKSEGWILLFDGKSLSGWDARTTFSKEATGNWSVAGGAISCPGTTPGWLSSKDSFSDFALKVEFRGTEKVNSGVFLRSQKEGEPHKTGYELQIWDYQPAGFLTGSLVGSVKATGGKVLGGQWNRYEITAKGDHIVIVLNGKKLLDTHNSQHASGVIGFQCQKENPIEFRNIKVRKLQ